MGLSPDVEIVMYTDNSSLCFAGADVLNIFHCASVFMEKLHDWTTTNSLKIIISKPKAVLFCPENMNINVVDETLVLDSRKIEIISTVKTLGSLFINMGYRTSVFAALLVRYLIYWVSSINFTIFLPMIGKTTRTSIGWAAGH